MTRLLSILILASTFILCCRHAKSDKEELAADSKSFKIDTSIIAILPFDTTTYQVFHVFKNCVPAELNQKDLLLIDKILIECIDEYNLAQTIRYNDFKIRFPQSTADIKDFTIDLKSYKRQYIAVSNISGEKEVWVNCFCNSSNLGSAWRNGLVFVLDGGNCYFNLKINLTKTLYYELMVNGNA